MSNGKYQIQITEEGKPTDIDAVGFQARLRGDAVRDCLLTLEPDNGCKLGLLTRSEIAGTVLESVLLDNEGSAALDIGKSRIAIASDDRNSRPNGLHISNRTSAFSVTLGNYQKEEHSENTLNLKDGRFPSNLILKHHKNCSQEGTREINVKGSGPVKGGAGYSKGGYDHGQKDVRPPFQGYASEEGTEEVANWVCDPSCPVHRMDQQSGNCISNSAKYGVQEGKNSFWGNSGDTIHRSNGTGDQHGGASRYFKQVQSDEELDSYLQTLVREQ